MPDDIKFTDAKFEDVKEQINFSEEKIVSANDPKGKRKIKFAPKSYSSFVNSIRIKIIEKRKSKAMAQYSDQFERIEENVEVAMEDNLERADEVITAQIDYLASIAIKIVKYDLQGKRLQQSPKAKPIRLRKNFVQNIENKFRNILDRRSENRRSRDRIFGNYKLAGEQLLSEMRSGTSVNDETVNRFNDPYNFVNAPSSLFANMQTPPVKVSSEEPKVHDDDVKPVEPEMPEPIDVYSSKPKFEFTPPRQRYSNSGEMQAEINENSAEEIDISVSPKKSTDNPGSDYLSELGKFNENINQTYPTIPRNQEPMKKVEEQVEPVKETPVVDSSIDLNTDLSQFSIDKLRALASMCRTAIEEKESEEYKAAEAARIEAERLREEAIRKQARKDTLLDNPLSRDEILTYLNNGTLTLEFIENKKQNIDTLSKDQVVNLYRLDGIVTGLGIAEQNNNVPKSK